MRDARSHAGGEHSLAGAVLAEGALLHLARRQLVAHLVGARGHAVLAPDAALGVDDDRAVLGAIAQLRDVRALDLPVGFDVEALDPGVEAADRHLVFLLARHSAGVASHAEGQIDQHSKFFLTHRLSLL